MHTHREDDPRYVDPSSRTAMEPRLDLQVAFREARFLLRKLRGNMSNQVLLLAMDELELETRTTVQAQNELLSLTLLRCVIEGSSYAFPTEFVDVAVVRQTDVTLATLFQTAQGVKARLIQTLKDHGGVQFSEKVAKQLVQKIQDGKSIGTAEWDKIMKLDSNVKLSNTHHVSGNMGQWPRVGKRYLPDDGDWKG